jgi:hypothetical protein
VLLGRGGVAVYLDERYLVFGLVEVAAVAQQAGLATM